MNWNPRMARVNRLVTFVRSKGECSMGEVEVELGIPMSTQYAIARGYKEFFPDIRLRRSTWMVVPVEAPVAVPLVRQDNLSSIDSAKNVGSKKHVGSRR